MISVQYGNPIIINNQPIICGWFQSHPLWFWAGLSLLVLPCFTTLVDFSCIMLSYDQCYQCFGDSESPVLRRLPPRCAAPLALAVLCRAAPRSGEQLLVRRVLPCLGASLHGPGAWGAPFEGTAWLQEEKGEGWRRVASWDLGGIFYLPSGYLT